MSWLFFGVKQDAVWVDLNLWQIEKIENEDVIKEIASMLLSIDKNMKVIKTEKTTSKSDGFYYIHTHQWMTSLFKLINY